MNDLTIEENTCSPDATGLSAGLVLMNNLGDLETSNVSLIKNVANDGYVSGLIMYTSESVTFN